MKLSEAFKNIKPAKCIRTTAKGITEIDTVSSSYSVITELFLQDNRIISLDNISQFQNLTRVALENNAISNIEEIEDLRYLPKLREIRLKGNPICNIPLFHQQVANFFADYIIIDSKRVHFAKNKAKFENNIIFSLFVSAFFSKIPKKPKIDFLLNQLNNFLKKNDYVTFAHKLRYSFLKRDDKTYFIHLRQICSQKIHSCCEKCGSFENLSNYISKIYYSKLSHLSDADIKRLKLPFFNNFSHESNLESNIQTNSLFPFADVNNFYSCCCFKKKPRIFSKVPNIPPIRNVQTDEKSTVAFDLNNDRIENNSITRHSNRPNHNLTEYSNVNELSISNSFSQSSGNNHISETSIHKVILKNDSKNWLSMPAIESDFSNLSFQRAVVFSEPFNTAKYNEKNLIKKLSIEESAEFSIFNTPIQTEPLLQENELIEFLKTSSSSSSNSKSRKSSIKLALSTSSSSSSFAVTTPINSPSPANKQNFSPNSKNKVKVIKSNTKMNLPSTLSTSSSSLDVNSSPINNDNDNNNNNNSLLINKKNNVKKEFAKSGVLSSFANNDVNTVSDANISKSENGASESNKNALEIEPGMSINNDEPVKKRKKIRRKKKTFFDDSVSEVFED